MSESALEDKKADLYILGKEKNTRELVEDVPLSKVEYETENGNKYKLRNDKVEGVDGDDLRFYFRAGDPEPLSWERFNGEFSNREMYMVKHDRSVIDSVMNALGIEGAGSLSRGQWAIIIGVAVAAAVAFFVLRPKIMGLIGM